CTQILFRQTTTLGVRAYTVNRYSLPRELATVILYVE
ncbi:MAG: LarC family nickel insertion protein, partial [Spirochaetes bacterium]|nr:LarC family nickel insertion protein [Spirochaetota bacterium]